MIKRQYTKEEFREQCRIATEVRNNEQLQYATAEIDLKYIQGIEDKECSQSFVSLSDYIRWLQKECVWEMDQVSMSAKAHEAIEEEMQFLAELEKNLEKIKYYLKELDSQAHNVKDLTEKINEKYGEGWQKYREPRKAEIRNTEQFLKKAEEITTGEGLKGPGYPEVRKQAYEKLEKQTQYFSSRDNSEWNEGTKMDLETRYSEKNVSNAEELFQNMDSYLNIVQNIEEEIENIRAEEKKHGNRQDWDEKQYERERRIEQKIERRLAKEITSLPNLKALQSKIEQKLKEAEKERQEISNGENPPRKNYLGLKI